MSKTDVYIENVRRGILSECSDDYVGMWSIVWLLRRDHKEASEAEIRRMAMEILRPLLEEGLIEAGPIEGDWSEAWSLPPIEVLSKIEALWDDFGSEPQMWDICWFRTTKKGDEAIESMSTSP